MYNAIDNLPLYECLCPLNKLRNGLTKLVVNKLNCTWAAIDSYFQLPAVMITEL